jgi:hypothetical protein
MEIVQDRAQWQTLILSAFNLRVLLTENQSISNMYNEETGCEFGRWLELGQEGVQR